MCNIITLLKYRPRHMPQVWKRKGSSWRCWQPSTEQWFVLAYGPILFEIDSHSSCKSSLALLLKMEQHTILWSICLTLSLRLPSLPRPCSAFYRLFILCPLCPTSSVSAPSSPSLLSMQRPQTHWQTERPWQRLRHTVAPAPSPMRW